MTEANEAATGRKSSRRAVLAAGGAAALVSSSMALAQGGAAGGAAASAAGAGTGDGAGRAPTPPPTAAEIAAALPLNSPGLEHFGMHIRNVPAAGMFYAALFNKELLQEPFQGQFRNYTVLKWGPRETPLTYIAVGEAMTASDPPGLTHIDHICAYLPATGAASSAAIAAALQQIGGKGAGNAGQSDPDGIPLQLFSISGGGIAGSIKSSGNVLDGESFFEPIGLKYFIIQASDFEKSVAYYEKVFGVPARRVASMQRAWLQIADDRLGIEAVPAGTAPRVYTFGVQVKPFNRAAAIRRLTSLGATIIPTSGDDEKALRFLSPFGIYTDIVEA